MSHRTARFLRLAYLNIPELHLMAVMRVNRNAEIEKQTIRYRQLILGIADEEVVKRAWAHIAKLDARSKSDTMELEVKLFWRHRNDYEWQVRDSANIIIAKGHADSFAKALAAGNKKAECLTKTQ
jgi:hypothetical protein